MSERPAGERRRQRRCPSCGGSGMIRGCKVPGVDLQLIGQGGEQRSGLIGLYSDVCIDCGFTSFYARRGEVTHEIEGMQGATQAEGSG